MFAEGADLMTPEYDTLYVGELKTCVEEALTTSDKSGEVEFSLLFFGGAAVGLFADTDPM